MLFQLLFVLMSVAFYTLFERKLLSLSQSRMGPNQTILWGILQPVLDGIKLIFKKMSLPIKGSSSFLFIPMIMFTSSSIIWLSIPSFTYSSLLYGGILFLLILGFLVYSILLTGWGAMSKYGSIGGVRSGAQSVSYEVSLTIILVGIFLSSSSYTISINLNVWWILFLLIWLISALAECNRAPFDFSEGESELISGFNVEYGSSGFVLLFLSEYSMMIMFSVMSDILFFKLVGGGVMVLVFLILARSTLPRFRYDKLMSLMWKIILPISCLTLLSVLSL